MCKFTIHEQIMRRMHPPRLALLSRQVLAWFLLSLAVAMASPLLRPQAMELVCTASGALKRVLGADPDAGPQARHHGLDCPLCLPFVAPPAASATPHLPPVPTQTTLRTTGHPAPASDSAAPPPARAPPAA